MVDGFISPAGGQVRPVVRLASRDRRQGLGFLFYRVDELLDGINLRRFIVGFTALYADPCRNSVKREVTTPPVCMKGSVAPFHFALAMHTFHFGTRTTRSSLSRKGLDQANLPLRRQGN